MTGRSVWLKSRKFRFHLLFLVFLLTLGTNKVSGVSGLQYCPFEQFAQLQGTWESPEDNEVPPVFTDMAECPAWARDFDCLNAEGFRNMTPEDQAHFRAEAAKIFRPEGCQLRPWSSEGMNTCLAGRKVLLLGDSLMRQQYVSLGCLLKSKTWMARAGIWGPALTNVLGDYTVKVNGDHKPILKQFLGDLHLHGNGSVHLRSFGQFNLSLWDDTLREFEQAYGKLTPRDIVMFNFGAWYPRLLPLNPWPTFMSSMQEFVMSRLRHLNATVIWKEYTPTHFGGHTGTFTWFHRDFRPSDPKCEPASRGEFWYDDYMRKVLEDCGERCKHIRILPVFNAALPRHNMHHGSVGRSYPQTDCRHFCPPVTDTFSLIFYNAVCFA